MPDRVAQDRVSLGCFWALAGGWVVISWVWSLLSGRGISLYDYIVVGLMVLAAAYSTYIHWRFPDAALLIDAPVSPGHAFRARIETPLRSEPPSGMRLRLSANHDVRRNASTIWSTVVEAHPIHGERGLIVPVELAIPHELADDGRPRWWELTVQARVPFGLYRATFRVPEG
jgi:hypothetical protein